MKSLWSRLTWRLRNPWKVNQDNPINNPTISRFIYVLGDAMKRTRRPDVDIVEIFRCEADGVVIPWLEGCTLKEAILWWAKQQKS